MKRTIKNIVYFLTLAVMVSSCKKQLEDEYSDPDKTTNPSIEKLFSGMLDNNRVRPQYWDMRTMQFKHTGVFSQSVAYTNSLNVYQQTDQYVESRWNDFYVPGNQSNDASAYNTGAGAMAEYRTIQRLFYNTPLADRANVEVFVMAARTLLLDQTSQMIDLFGDIPYTEAGGLDVSNTITNAKFQDQKALYDTVMLGLKDMSDYFGAISLNTNAAASFSVQDFVMHGSLDKWRRYANSVRLRLLMRTSFVDEATAKAAVQEMFSSPIQFPLVDGGNIGDNYNPGNSDILLTQPTTYTDNLTSAFTEIRAHAAPDYMLNTLMLPANDPRIPFMFDKFGPTVNKVFTPNPTYRAMSATMGSASQADSLPYFSTVDSTTYLKNSKLPGIMMTASEVNFLRAEAVERWGLTGPGSLTAQQYYELAVRQAIVFAYYLYNSNSIKYEELTQPSSTVVDNFLAQPSIAYTGTTDQKLGKIWNQKWLHFGFLQTTQAWAETRRTKYPKFPSVFVSDLAGYETAPKRLMYPASEISYNTSYSEVAAKNTRDTKIFWDVQP